MPPKPGPNVNNGVDVPTFPAIAPLRLASDYRDYFGRQHEKFVELLDPFLAAGCFIPKIFHAPSSADEAVGLTPGGYLDYALELPPGSFILGFLHKSLSQNTTSEEAPAVSISGFRLQITDIGRNYKLFGKPVPESWLLNDELSLDPNGPVQGALFELNPALRLLAAPYPVAPPAQFRIEFWDTRVNADTNNVLVQLTLVVAVPPEEFGHGQ